MSSTSILSYLILSLCVVYAFAYPYYQEVGLLGEEKNKYEESLALVADIESKKNALIQEYENIGESDKIKISTVLPDSLNFVRLISQISEVGASDGILISNISMRETDSSVGNSIAEAEPPRPYNSAVIGFSFDASYAQFNSFMSRLEKSLRILDIRSVQIQTAENGRYSYKVEFETYWVK